MLNPRLYITLIWPRPVGYISVTRDVVCRLCRARDYLIVRKSRADITAFSSATRAVSHVLSRPEGGFLPGECTPNRQTLKLRDCIFGAIVSDERRFPVFKNL